MSSRLRAFTTSLFVVLVAGCSTPTSPQGQSTSASVPVQSTAQPPDLLVPVASDLTFPKRRRLPIFARVEPDSPTPETVIDAFLDLVHDPALRYRVESTGRWSRGGDELLEARRVDHDRADRYLRSSTSSGLPAEAIVRGGEAVARQEGGPWMPERADLLRQLDDLSSSVVIGDLGPEPGGGYRLVIASGFDSVPRGFVRTDGNLEDMTEIVIDDGGRPLSLTYHRWATLAIVGNDDFVEGVVNASFSLVGGAISIPSIDGRAPSTTLSEDATDPLIRSPLPGIGLSVLIPVGAATEERHLTYYSPANRASGIDLTALAVSSDGLRYEVAVGEVPAKVFEGSTARDRIKGIRRAVPSRTPNGDMIGYRYLDVAGALGQEVVATGQYDGQRMGLLRIRTVFIDRRLIVLVVGGPSDRVGSAVADRFLRSLVAS